MTDGSKQPVGEAAPGKPGSRRPRFLRRWAASARRLRRDQRGATTLEWALLLLVIALPSYALIQISLNTLVAHYRMITQINSLPFP